MHTFIIHIDIWNMDVVGAWYWNANVDPLTGIINNSMRFDCFHLFRGIKRNILATLLARDV